ncbi:helix-turn-helix domain-containing protein [Streptomyces sp. NPDC000594]|uniref:helix-turn-helix domain-containing protein n=1 Tax=Streptomyces sp. NPDC000594 TaxID=3154261 RepID=UPI00331A1F89
MGDREHRPPGGFRDSDEFLDALRQLKDRSGLTYRQLEEKAAQSGDVLPRSTIADVLRGKHPPRAPLLVAFLRACGEERWVAEWLAARDAMVLREKEAGTGPGDAAPPAVTPAATPAPVLSSAPDPVPTSVPDPAPTAAAEISGKRPRAALWWLLAAVVAAVAVLVGMLAPWSGSDGGGAGTREEAMGVPEKDIRIRPVLAPRLCLTDGHAPRYSSVVAVQRPCDQVLPQRTSLLAVTGDSFRIQWYRPDQGAGCLKVLESGRGTGLLEPWDRCDLTTRFRFEAVGKKDDRRYRIRTGAHGCVGMRGASAAEDVEAVVEPCREGRGQTFMIEPVPDRPAR